MEDKNALAGSETDQSTDLQPDPDPSPDPEKLATEDQKSDTDASAADADSDAQTDGDDAGKSKEGEDGDKLSDKAKEAIEGTAKRKGTKPSERISRLTAQKRELEARARSAERRAQKAEERLAKQQGEPKPKSSDFDSVEDHDAALAAWHVRQSSKSDRELDVADAQDEAKEASEEAQRIAQETFTERARDFAETAPDFFERANDPGLPVSKEMLGQIYDSDQGPQIVYWLSENKGEASRIAQLKDAGAVAREIGRIEGRLTQPEPRRVSQAPKPVKSEAKGSGSQSSFVAAKASRDDIAKRLRAKGVIQ